MNGSRLTDGWRRVRSRAGGAQWDPFARHAAVLFMNSPG
jgi:hypothetical protein